MSTPLKASFAMLCALSFINLACFNSYRISLSELEKLQTGFEAEEVPVIIDHCDVTPTSGNPVRVAQADSDAPTPVPTDDDIDPATGCPVVYVSSTSPISVVTTRGESHRITPFNFTLSETQLVSPDYDLLLPRNRLEEAEIEVFSTGKTIALIGTITAVAVGSFLAISLLAPPDRGLGGN